MTSAVWIVIAASPVLQILMVVSSFDPIFTVPSAELVKLMVPVHPLPVSVNFGAVVELLLANSSVAVLVAFDFGVNFRAIVLFSFGASVKLPPPLTMVKSAASGPLSVTSVTLSGCPPPLKTTLAKVVSFESLTFVHEKSTELTLSANAAPAGGAVTDNFAAELSS